MNRRVPDIAHSFFRGGVVSVLVLALYVVALVVLFGVRSWVQRRRTGSTGLHGISGTPAGAGWSGGAVAER
jgi:hypothetical protein